MLDHPISKVFAAFALLLFGQAHALETCDLNNDGITGIADLVLLQQELTDPTNGTPPQEPISLTIGTGATINELTSATYSQEWTISATDLVGDSIRRGSLQVDIRSLFYRKGFLVTDVVAGQWRFSPANDPPIQCADEDVNQNGILEPAEDLNGSGQIEAGVVALLAPVPHNSPPDFPCGFATPVGRVVNVTTNDSGIARVCVVWPQNYSWWLDTLIRVTATVGGNDYTKSQIFMLPAQPSVINDITTQPPHVVSPFGYEQDCTIPPPGLP